MALTKVAPAGIGSTPGDGYRIGNSFLHSTGLDITNINATGILTAASLDISGAIDFDGDTELDNINVSGVSTFAGAIDANGALDVDGQTDLDVLNVSDIATFAANVSIADKIIHTGDTNTAIRFPSNDVVAVETAGSEKLRIDASGRVLIGTTTPQGNANADDLVVATSATTGITIRSGTSNNGNLFFADGTSGNDEFRGWVTYDHNNDRLTFGTNAAERLVLTAAGSVGINSTSPDRRFTLHQDATCRMNLKSLSNSTAGIEFGDEADHNAGYIVYDNTDNSFQVGLNGTGEKLRINSSGRVGIKNTLNHTFNSNSNTLCIGDGGGAVGMTIWTAAGADGQFVSFQTNESLSRAEGEISYGPPNTNTAGDRNAMMFRTNSGERLRIDSSGRVLIGVTASRSVNSAQGSFQIEGTGAEDSDMSIIRNQNNAGGPAICFGKSRSGSLAGNTVVQSGDQFGSIIFMGNDGTDLASQGARIDAACDGTPGSNDMPGRITFSTTADGAASATERMRINKAGRLLLGTTIDNVFNGNRNARFQQEGLNAADAAFALCRHSADTGPAFISLGKTRGTSLASNTAVQNGDGIGCIEFNAGDGSGALNTHAKIIAEVDGAPGNSDAPGRIAFYTTPDGGSTTPAERVRIDSSGNIGINQTSPNARIEITDTNTAQIRLGWNQSKFIRIGRNNSGHYEFLSQENGSPLVFGTAASADGGGAEKMRIDRHGRLLQGITSARGNFGNNTSGVEVSRQLEGTSYTTACTSIIRNSNDGNDGGIILGKTRAGSVGGNTTVQSGDFLGEIMWAGADGTTLLEGARIDAVVESGVGNDDMPTALRFLTNSGTTSPSERMRINAAGHIKIGSGSATGIHNLAKVLEISGGDGGDLIIGNDASSNVSAGMHVGAIAFKNIDSSTGSTPHYAGIRCETSDTSGNMDLRFYTGINKLESDDPQLRITSVGDVLINEPPEASGRLTIRGGGAYTVGNSGKALEGLDIQPATVGNGNFGGAISLGCGGNGRSAIAAVQVGSDDDVNGLAFFTHGSNNGSDDTVERVRIGTTGQVHTKLANTTDYGPSNWARTGSGNQGGANQSFPDPAIVWQNLGKSSSEQKYGSYIQSSSGGEKELYITIRNSSFYRITVKTSHNSTDADVAMWLVYGLNSSASGGTNNRIVNVVNTSSGGFTCTQQNTHVNSHDSTIKIAFSGSSNQGLRALVEIIGGF